MAFIVLVCHTVYVERAEKRYIINDPHFQYEPWSFINFQYYPSFAGTLKELACFLL